MPEGRIEPRGGPADGRDGHVELRAVTKRFGDNPPAVDRVDLTVPRGSFTTLLGPSGCGKTTLLRLIAGLYEPDGGDVIVDGKRMNGVPAHRRGTAMVFQDYALFPHMSVAENVGYGLKLAGIPTEKRNERVRQTLGFLGLTGLEERSPNRLSGGQQQRVALARALVVDPKVLLLDEPLSNLDAKLRVRIREELTSIQRQLGLTTIYVTHDQDEALAMSDWIAVMNRGVVVQWGTPDQIYYRPRTPFVADFVGSVNLFEGAKTDGTVQVGGEQLLSVRPESLVLQPAGSVAAAGLVALPGEVVRRTFLGHLMRYTVQAADREWLVDQPDPGAATPLEGAVSLLIDPARVHVVEERDADPS